MYGFNFTQTPKTLKRAFLIIFRKFVAAIIIAKDINTHQFTH